MRVPGFLVAAVVLAIASSGSAQADDRSDCLSLEPVARLASCDRLIRAKRLKGVELARVLNARGEALAAQRKFDQAFSDFNQAIRLHPKLAQAFFNRADISLSHRSDSTAALSDLNACIALNPDHVAALQARGNLLRNRRSYDLAIASFSQVIRLQPSSARAFIQRAEVLILKGDDAAAIADLGEAIRLDPRSDTSLKTRAAAFQRMLDHDRAIADLTEAIRMNPADNSAFADRGASYFEKKDYDGAIADLDRVELLAPNYMEPKSYMLRGRAHAAKQNHERAVADFERAIARGGGANALTPEAAKEYAQGKQTLIAAKLAACLSVDASLDERIRECERAVSESKVDKAELLGILKERSGEFVQKSEYDRAIADIGVSKALDPNEVWHAIAFAVLNLARGDADRAISEVNEGLKLNPDPVGMAFLKVMRAYAFVEKRDFTAAIPDLNERVEAEPHEIALRLMRGRAYLGAGQYREAMSDLDEVLRLKSEPGSDFNDELLLRLMPKLTLPEDEVRALRDAARAGLERGSEPAAATPQAAEGVVPAPAAEAEPKEQQPESAIVAAKTVDDANKPIQQAAERDAVAKDEGPASALFAARTPPAAEQAVPKVDKPAGKRVALVIGNAAYRHVPTLDNTITDARTMREVLARLGFEVIYGENLDRRAMGRHIGEFGIMVRDAEAAIVYFAGHGSTFADIPYVVPVDSKYEKLGDIPSELIQVETLVGELRRAKGVRLVILDACRDNEREIVLKRQDAALRGEATRGGAVAGGLARLKNPDGLIVVYSTQHMTTASDGAPGGNSPFTGALARHLVTPGIDIKDALFRTANEVVNKTGNMQRPEIAISLFEPFVLAQ
ncbi:MAG: caspase family protein [Pseudorhodoplanes sp.]|uniref:caspase family protein n=1 Tax=Pseudorhodoplanes sp. TaxID=1934341 RepID=UPI003D0C897B